LDNADLVWRSFVVKRRRALPAASEPSRLSTIFVDNFVDDSCPDPQNPRRIRAVKQFA
jgi:hypothetical protein